ncbi:hypothetical protein 44RRORF237c [Aeromonas phage 44RR2.8t]|uniref:Uncharacterized protein n=2 Tax=Biquartavirus 44RR2 TaxID=115987 RepID=Q6U965_9CAUD|nr:hypothetical protein ST44RRORF237c [Aeromonas phage 44RR2.8t]AAQ81555.1 hypothetical protein 44RRORF237c [Aeromonas phage 44RR2.8t]APU00709.1 hypothetical protein [Aeromonas phage 44RR2.8t.2]
MKFTKNVIVNRTYELSAEEFVNHHLRELRIYRNGGKVEYDCFVQCGVQPQFITHAISLPHIDFDVNDFDRYARTEEEKARHQSACKRLIKLIEVQFEKEEKS